MQDGHFATFELVLCANELVVGGGVGWSYDRRRRRAAHFFHRRQRRRGFTVGGGGVGGVRPDDRALKQHTRWTDVFSGFTGKKLFLLCHYYFIFLFQTKTASSTLFCSLWIFNQRRDKLLNAVMFLTIYAAITRFFFFLCVMRMRYLPMNNAINAVEVP